MSFNIDAFNISTFIMIKMKKMKMLWYGFSLNCSISVINKAFLRREHIFIFVSLEYI